MTIVRSPLLLTTTVRSIRCQSHLPFFLPFSSFLEFRVSKIGWTHKYGSEWYAGPQPRRTGTESGDTVAARGPGGVRSVRNLRNLARGGRCWRGNDTDYQLGFGQACRGVLSPLGGGRRRGACRRGAPPPRDPWNRYRVLSSANAGRSSRSASLTRSPARWAWPARPPRPIGARLATPGLPSASRRVPRPLADGVGWIWSALPNERRVGMGMGRGWGAVWGKRRG